MIICMHLFNNQLAYFFPAGVRVEDNPDGKVFAGRSRTALKRSKFGIEVLCTQPVHAAADGVDGKSDQEDIAEDPSVQLPGEHRFKRPVTRQLKSQTVVLPPPQHGGHRRLTYINAVYIYICDPRFAGNEHPLPGAVHDGGATGEKKNEYGYEITAHDRSPIYRRFSANANRRITLYSFQSFCLE